MAEGSSVHRVFSLGKDALKLEDPSIQVFLYFFNTDAYTVLKADYQEECLPAFNEPSGLPGFRLLCVCKTLLSNNEVIGGPSPPSYKHKVGTTL